MPINVFVAENHTLVRQGIISLLENECEVNVVVTVLLDTHGGDLYRSGPAAYLASREHNA